MALADRFSASLYKRILETRLKISRTHLQVFWSPSGTGSPQAIFLPRQNRHARGGFFSPFFLADLSELAARPPPVACWAAMVGEAIVEGPSLSTEFGDSPDTDGEGESSGPCAKNGSWSRCSRVLLKEASGSYKAGCPAMRKCCTVGEELYDVWGFEGDLES
jgi:hypothetical protein